jgi:hypothetical protein
MLAIAVAAPVFQQLPSKTLAGNLNAIILGRMNMIEWICGSIAFISSIVLLAMNWGGEYRTLRIIETCLIFLMVTMLWFYSSRMTGRMTELRATIQDFDHPRETTEYVEAKKEFDELHKNYTMFVGINMILITSTFVLSIVNTRAG